MDKEMKNEDALNFKKWWPILHKKIFVRIVQAEYSNKIRKKCAPSTYKSFQYNSNNEIEKKIML